MYPSSPHTIHPPHIASAILGESLIALRRLRIYSNNIVSLLHAWYRLKFTRSMYMPYLLLSTYWPSIPEAMNYLKSDIMSGN